MSWVESLGDLPDRPTNAGVTITKLVVAFLPLMELISEYHFRTSMYRHGYLRTLDEKKA